MRRTLGELIHDDDDATLRIVSTLRVYLQENRSRTTRRQATADPREHDQLPDPPGEDILATSMDSNALNLSVALALLPSVRDLA